MRAHSLGDAFTRVTYNKDLVLQFFISFSLFEKALKESGFYSGRLKEGVSPNWVKFAKQIDGQFNTIITSQEDPELQMALEYFDNDPPSKQIVENKFITFAPTVRPDNMCNTEWLSVLIRRVRNNLFHGGKFRGENERDETLIKHSLIILGYWADLNERIQSSLGAVQ